MDRGMTNKPTAIPAHMSDVWVKKPLEDSNLCLHSTEWIWGTPKESYPAEPLNTQNHEKKKLNSYKSLNFEGGLLYSSR